VLKGNKEAILPQVNSIVLTETAAADLFGSLNPINKIVTVSHMFATDSVEVDLTCECSD